jgi:DNA mismatch repair protein MutS
MQQYNRIKAQYPDAILLFRVGDFYETFGEDAVRASQALDIVLTKRGNGSASEIELAGFPHHALDNYLPKLVRAGNRVAVCDQLEDPKFAKGIVKRGITELVTPGATFHDQVLQSRANNYLAALHFGKAATGVAFLDLSTGEFQAGQGTTSWVERWLRIFAPSEVLYERDSSAQLNVFAGESWHKTRLDDWIFRGEYGREKVQQHFGTQSLKGFGLDDWPEAVTAAGAILQYLEITHHHEVRHIRQIRRLTPGGYLALDRFTIRNLELVQPLQPDGRSLLEVIDCTRSPMGGRMMRRWLLTPLTHIPDIEKRQSAVEAFVLQPEVREAVARELSKVGDMERLASKASSRRISPRELAQLRKGLHALHTIADLTAGEVAWVPFLENLQPCDALLARLDRELADEPALTVSRGEVMRAGVFPDLDRLRGLKDNAHEALDAICRAASLRTGISSLKIDSNQVFGYYIEVRNAHKDKVPSDWIRKQTLTQAERYITEELKQLEAQILEAESGSEGLEQQLLDQLVAEVAEAIAELQDNAAGLAQLDVLASFAEVAERQGYCKPVWSEEFTINITQGRHPVIEQVLPTGQAYVANDLRMDPQSAQLLMITGPNMSGKSALLRQTALICLLGQTGSFVPAQQALLSPCDRIFSRVGASDNLATGESTFMVEMNETASIVNNLTGRSLVILDEIGRGTSTYDGVSIAWALAEFLHEHPEHRALTLFATHYHELNDMASRFPRIRNMNVQVQEVGGQVVFLRKLVEGGSNHSFGIHVARLAGLPPRIIDRATEVLRVLERRSEGGEASPGTAVAAAGPSSPHPAGTGGTGSPGMQLSFFQLDDPVLLQIRDQVLGLDIDNLTPIEALMRLHEIRKVLSGKGT